MTVLCISMFSDGLSTSTPTLHFNLYWLAAWTEVQEKVYKDVQAHLPPESPARQKHAGGCPTSRLSSGVSLRGW